MPYSDTTIDFSPERWDAVKSTSQQWWNHELGRPLIQATVTGRDPGRAAAAHPFHPFTTQYDLSVTADEIVDSWDEQLSRAWYMGDAFPSIWPNFGPGVIAAFLGARLEGANDTVWYHPQEHKPVGEWSFSYDPANVWLQRVNDIIQAATARWQGQVQVGMTDLGGNLDILASFRPSEELLLDLYDDPAAVKRLTWQAHELWHRYYTEMNDLLQPVNPGYTAWAPIFSETPYYMLQCDFCYMISPDMFDEFVKPELAATCKKLDHAFYHLDGPGELPHLDSLLDIEELAGVQWVPGAGVAPITEWPEVYRKISTAGKLIQIYGTIDELDIIANQIGRADNIVCIAGYDAVHRDDVEKGLARYGIDG